MRSPQRYVIYASIQGYIVYDRLDRVQIGDDVPTYEQAQERIRVIMRNHPERV